ARRHHAIKKPNTATVKHQMGRRCKASAGTRQNSGFADCRIGLLRIKAARKRAAPAALGLLAAQAPASAGAPAN
ncbi:hypothetical protein ACIBPB_32520, partial [Micromonospora sp. NPDC049836]|uniref:hypothetical protein n=1 Tax=Micromonospora sp. NPDC049836 TaxID=3364274 RepID=UPI0037B80615